MSPSATVAIVIPTYNEERNLPRLLSSIQMQHGVAYEVVIVDQESSDHTVEIAQRYGCRVVTVDRPPFYTPPGANRNLGAAATSSEVLLNLDADMQLPGTDFLERLVNVISDCHQAVVIHEIDVAFGFWSKCKALERRCYWGTQMEAARAVTRLLFDRVGGYDSRISSGEDFDISRRYRLETALTSDQGLFLYHHTGSCSLRLLLLKKFRYGRTARAYLARADASEIRAAGHVMGTALGAYLRNIAWLVKDPLHYFLIWPLRLMEFFALVVGIMVGNPRSMLRPERQN